MRHWLMGRTPRGNLQKIGQRAGLCDPLTGLILSPPPLPFHPGEGVAE